MTPGVFTSSNCRDCFPQTDRYRGPRTNPKRSPDGKQIAYATYGVDPFLLRNSFNATVPDDGGTPNVLTKEFDENASLVGRTPDGIYFSALQKTAAHVFQLDPATRAVHRLGAGPNRFAEAFVSSTSADGNADSARGSG